MGKEENKPLDTRKHEMLTKNTILKTIEEMTVVANDMNRPELARKMARQTIERMQKQYETAPEELDAATKYNMLYCDAIAQVS
jgi:hypothetical protein